MRIAVTGAFGFSGRYIARRLLARGDELVTLTNRRPIPDLGGSVDVYPLDFEHPERLTEALRGVEVLVNTYWVRFDYGRISYAGAVENSARLIAAAKHAGVRRIVHVSITNPEPDSPLPYFRGKAQVEEAVRRSGLSYAILRPTVFFGEGDVLINNIAFLLRRLPIFFLPGRGDYRLQPVHVDDFAAVVVETVERDENSTWDVVGPEVFSFREMLGQIAMALGLRRLFVSVPPGLALWASALLGRALGDVLLTRDELRGLMANLLLSAEAPRATTRLSEWLVANRHQLGRVYASELARHYLR